MNVTVRELSREDNAALLALAAASSGTADAFAVDRAPDYFALGGHLGQDALHLGAETAGGDLVGSIAVVRQSRSIGERPVDAYYVHDLRVAVAHRRRGVARALAAAAARARDVPWWFSTILDGNARKSALLGGLAEGIDVAGAIGRTAHVGLPLFGFAGRAAADVVVLTEAEFEAHHATLAGARAFAPVGAAPWAALPGEYVGVARGSQVLAVAKMCLASPGRRFVALRSGAAAACMGPLVRLAGAPRLPRAGETLAVGYLAFYAAATDAPWDLELRRYAMKKRRGAVTYLFRGMDPAAARTRRFPIGTIRFSSTTWAFGRPGVVPSMDVHELTLM